MTTYNTGHPVGSVDVKDLYDNAQNLDHLVNDRGVTEYSDRLGVPRKSWYGMEQDFNTFLLNSQFEYPPLNYVDGTPLTVLRASQLIQRSGQLYRVRLPATFPVNLTGTWATDAPLLTAMSDAALRQDLASSGSGLGASIVARAVQCVPHLTALRGLLKTSPSSFAQVFGFAVAGDGGGGLYWYDATDTTSADNNGTIIVATDGARWKSVENGPIPATRFGVLGKGANYAANLNAAIAYLVSLGGGKLILPRGDIRLNSTVLINSSNICIEGAGNAPGGTRIVNGQASLPAIQFGDGANQYGTNRITGVTFGQASGVTAIAGNCALRAINQLDFDISRSDCLPYPAPLYDGFRIEDSTFVWGHQNRFTGNLHDGCTFLRCVDVHMVSCRSDSNSWNGWTLTGSQGIYWHGVTGYNNTNSAFVISSDGTTHSFNMFFHGCIGDTSGSNNWFIQNLAGAEFTASWASTNQSTAVNTSAVGFIISGPQTRDLEFTGCIGIYNNAHGMQILAGARIKIRGGQYGNPVHGNGRAVTGDGINIQPGSVSDISISAQCCGNSGYGVSIPSGPTGIKVDGGEYTGNTTGAINGIPNAQYVKNAAGVNPRMFNVTTPAVPATGVGATNNTGVDVMVYIRGGTVSNVALGSTVVAVASPAQVLVPAGQSITLTYSAVPTWVWAGL